MSLLPRTTLHGDSEYFVCRCVIIKGTGEFEEKKNFSKVMILPGWTVLTTLTVSFILLLQCILYCNH
jgi:hypothetical protein